jgi:hypothetical protein
MTLIRVPSLLSTTLLTAVAIATVSAQQLTIPQSLARAADSLSNFVTVPSGLPPRMEEVLLRTDLIVAGTLGQPHSYMSRNEMEVYTDYPIIGASILFQTNPETLAKPAVGQPLAATFLGGTVVVNGLTFTSKHEGLPLPQAGTECLLLLEREEGHYVVAQRYFGAFHKINDALVPMTMKQNFAPEYGTVSAAQATDRLVATATRVRTNRLQ